MDQPYVRMMALSGYQSLRLDDIHNAMQTPVFQRQPAVLRLSLNKEPTWHSAPSPWKSRPAVSQPGPDSQPAPERFLVQDRYLSPERLSTPATPSQWSAMRSAPTQEQMALWVYSDPCKLYLVPMSKSAPVAKLRAFIESHLHLGSDAYTLANLSPGASYPVPLMKFSSDLDSGVTLCLPNKNITLLIQHSENNHAFGVQINPLQTIRDLKMLIQTAKGYSLKQQELLYNNRAMQNQQQILDYQLRSNTKLYLTLQPSPPLVLQLGTFWGCQYQLDTDSSVTVRDLLHQAVRRTCEDGLAAERLLQQVADYTHLFVFMYNDKPLELDQCLCYYNIHSGATIQLLAASDVNHDDYRRLTVLLDDKQVLVATGAAYDTLFMIALKAHGHLKIPMDKLTLYVNDRAMDAESVLSEVDMDDDYVTVRVIKERPKEEYDLHDQVLMDIKLPNGRVHSLHCYGRDHISKVKELVADSGFAHAQLYDLLYKRVRLPTQSKVADYKLPERVDMELKLYEIPVQVIQANNTVTVSVSCDRPMSDLLKKIEDKVGCSSLQTALVHAGNDLYNIGASYLRSSGLFINSKVYVEPIQALQAIHLVSENEVMPLPTKPTLDPLHLKQLTLTCFDVDVFLEAFQWFIKWRFPEKMRFQHSHISKRGLRHKRSNTTNGTGLHQTLQAARDSLKSSGTEGKSDGETIPTERDNKMLNRFLAGLPAKRSQEPSSRSQDSRLPVINSTPDRLSSLSGKSSIATHRSDQSTARSSSQRTAGDSAANNTSGRKKRSVRFDIPESETTRSGKAGNVSNSGPSLGGRSKSVWHNSKKFLDRQSIHHSNHSNTPGLTRGNTDIPDHKHRHPNYRAFQSFPIPRWHHSQMPMQPNFTSDITLNGSTLNALPLKPTTPAKSES